MIDNLCLCCGRKLKEEDCGSLFYQRDLLCRKCRQQLMLLPVKKKLEGLKITGLYPYSGLVRDLILQYKQDGDEALGPVFLYPLRNFLAEKYRDYILVEMPSSAKMLAQRGFHHVEGMFSLIGQPVYSLFEKTDDTDQKSLTFEKRGDIGRHIRITDENFRAKKVLLVDDIITSGSTLLAAYRLLKPRVSGSIQALTVAYNRHFLPGWLCSILEKI